MSRPLPMEISPTEIMRHRSVHRKSQEVERLTAELLQVMYNTICHSSHRRQRFQHLFKYIPNTCHLCIYVI